MSKKLLVGATVMAIVALVATACGGGGGGGESTPEVPAPTPTPIPVVEEPNEEATHEHEDEGVVEEDEHEGAEELGHLILTEWRIAGHGGEPLETLDSGPYMFEVHNEGKTIHQLAIWRGGEVVGDEVQGGTLVAETDFIQPGDVALLSLDLEPGEYLFTCPIAGHTELGMHTEVTVQVHVE